MTVITPRQRQLVFTADSQPRYRHSTLSWFKVLRRFSTLVSERKVFLLLLGISVVSFLGLCFMAIDSVLLSFKIQHLSQVLENNQLVKERLELQRVALFSPEFLQNYAKVIELSRPASISYLSQDNPDSISSVR